MKTLFEFRLLAMLLIACLISTVPLHAQERSKNLDYAHLQESCVAIFLNGQMAGSGTFVNSTGTVLTAAHVVPSLGQKVEIMSRKHGRLPAKVLAADAGCDLMLLQTDLRETSFVPLAASLPPHGSSVHCFSWPMFRHEILLHARVARQEPNYEFMTGAYVEVSYLSGFAPKGSSGGAWVNNAGEIIGVQNAQMSVNEAPQGVIFMTPVKGIRELVERREHAKTVDLLCGLDELWEHPPSMRKAFGQEEGLVIQVIQPRSPIREAKIPEGTLLMKIDGKPTGQRPDFIKALRQKKPGEKVELTIKEKGKDKVPQKVTVTLPWLEEKWVEDAP